MTKEEFEMNLILLGFVDNTLCPREISKYRLGSITVNIFEDTVDIYRPDIGFRWYLSFRKATEFLIDHLDKANDP